MGRRFNIPNQTNTMRLKDKAAPLVTTKEIMPIKSNVTRQCLALISRVARYTPSSELNIQTKIEHRII